MENGHSLTKADLQAALTDLSKDFRAALSAQGQEFHNTVTGQGQEFRVALTAQAQEFHAALTNQGKDYERFLQAALATQGQQFDGKLDALREELKEFSRGIETNLLTAFHGYGKGQQARMHTIEITEADFKLRLAAIEERVLALESRRPPPDPPQN